MTLKAFDIGFNHITHSRDSKYPQLVSSSCALELEIFNTRISEPYGPFEILAPKGS